MARSLPPPSGGADTNGDGNGKGTKRVGIQPPKTELIYIPIRGADNSPLIVSAFSRTKVDPMRAKMEEGSTAQARRRQRDPRDWDADLEAARHVLSDGSDGFAASSVRNAAISACRLLRFPMTLAKLSIFVEADGYDVEDATPLVRIVGPAPERSEMVTRLPNGSPNIAIRPLWRQWGAVLKVRYDTYQFTVTDIGNLIMRVGQQVGLCEGRPDSKNSAGIGAGLFHVLTDASMLDDLRALDPHLPKNGNGDHARSARR